MTDNRQSAVLVPVRLSMLEKVKDLVAYLVQHEECACGMQDDNNGEECNGKCVLAMAQIIQKELEELIEVER